MGSCSSVNKKKNAGLVIEPGTVNPATKGKILAKSNDDPRTEKMDKGGIKKTKQEVDMDGETYFRSTEENEFDPKFRNFPPRHRITMEELYQSYMEDAKEVKLMMEEEVEEEDCVDTDILNRFIKKISKGYAPPKGDPNMQVFPFPDDVNPLELRLGFRNFHFQVGRTEFFSTFSAGQPLRDVHETFASSLRPWLRDWKPMTVRMDGVKFVQSDLIKRDVPTEEQLQIIEERSNRGTPGKNMMQRKRKRLMKYFQEKYDMSDDTTAKYSNFASSLEKAQLELDELCRNDN